MKYNPSLLTSLTLTFVVAFSGCTKESMQAKGFALPNGNAEVGEAVFRRLECHQCHRVVGVELPTPNEQAPVDIELGGNVTRVQTYGDLVTSIINPSHRLKVEHDQVVAENGESLMTAINDVMTVSELIDVVAFLASKYEVVIPPVAYPGYLYL